MSEDEIALSVMIVFPFIVAYLISFFMFHSNETLVKKLPTFLFGVATGAVFGLLFVNIIYRTSKFARNYTDDIIFPLNALWLILLLTFLAIISAFYAFSSKRPPNFCKGLVIGLIFFIGVLSFAMYIAFLVFPT